MCLRIGVGVVSADPFIHSFALAVARHAWIGSPHEKLEELLAMDALGMVVGHGASGLASFRTVGQIGLGHNRMGLPSTSILIASGISRKQGRD